MHRLIVLLLLLNALCSCSKREVKIISPPVIIPDIINGAVTDFNVTPVDILTPDKGTLLIESNNTIYKAVFNAVDQAQSNAILSFKSDTILIDDSREFANLGKDAIAYNPVAENEVTISFKDGRGISGTFAYFTSFGGFFGEQLIAQWRDPVNPAKPNQKAKDDIKSFVRRYSDRDGPGPANDPVYLSVTVSIL